MYLMTSYVSVRVHVHVYTYSFFEGQSLCARVVLSLHQYYPEHELFRTIVKCDESEFFDSRSESSRGDSSQKRYAWFGFPILSWFQISRTRAMRFGCLCLKSRAVSPGLLDTWPVL